MKNTKSEQTLSNLLKKDILLIGAQNTNVFTQIKTCCDFSANELNIIKNKNIEKLNLCGTFLPFENNSLATIIIPHYLSLLNEYLALKVVLESMRIGKRMLIIEKTSKVSKVYKILAEFAEVLTWQERIIEGYTLLDISKKIFTGASRVSKETSKNKRSTNVEILIRLEPKFGTVFDNTKMAKLARKTVFTGLKRGFKVLIDSRFPTSLNLTELLVTNKRPKSIKGIGTMLWLSKLGLFTKPKKNTKVLKNARDMVKFLDS
ncbi:hypothetical protein OAR19_00270 [bacterium]|nr:hypothetical protein [bacterium]